MLLRPPPSNLSSDRPSFWEPSLVLPFQVLSDLAMLSTPEPWLILKIGNN